MDNPAALRQLLEAIDALDTIQNTIAATVRSTGDQRKAEVVKLRRSFAEQIAVVGALGEAAFEGGDPVETKEFRSKLSKMRTAVALHQAKWPAVSLDEDPASYQRSAQSIAISRKDFISWTRTRLSAKLGHTGA